jgi:hypothetical protein
MAMSPGIEFAAWAEVEVDPETGKSMCLNFIDDCGRSLTFRDRRTGRRFCSHGIGHALMENIIWE